MLFPPSFIADVRDRADIVQVVQDYVPLKKAGSTWKGLCPFHNEKTPSFTVNSEKGLFYCFGCQAGGDVFKFVELQEKVGFQDAVRLLARKFGLTVPEPTGTDESDSVERETLLKIHEVAAPRPPGRAAASSSRRAASRARRSRSSGSGTRCRRARRSRPGCSSRGSTCRCWSEAVSSCSARTGRASTASAGG